MRDYLSEMLYALTSAYTRKDYDNRRRSLPVETNIGKLFSVFAWGLDSVHEQADLIKLWDDLDYARGSVLDRYGANFGVKRFGATDAFYRLTIKIKLLSQLSGGDINTVMNAAATLFEIPAEKILLGEVFPAKISLDVNEADLTEETLSNVVDIVEMIKRILAAGVGIIPTLRSYRDFENTAPINTDRFDRSHINFDLPDARDVASEGRGVACAAGHVASKVSLVASAAFERSCLTFDLPDARRRFTSSILSPETLFERTHIRTEPVPPEPQTFHGEGTFAFALFEYHRISIKPCY